MNILDATPTTVVLADGTTYVIPSGTPGSWPWAIQASKIAVAYQQLGDPGKALAWQREYAKRKLVFDSVEGGRDIQAVIDELGGWGAFLLAPFELAYDFTKGLIESLRDLAQAGIKIVNWTPIVAAGIVVVLGIGLYKGSLGYRKGF